MFGCHPHGTVEGAERRVLDVLPASDDPTALTASQVHRRLPDVHPAFVDQLLFRLRDRGLAYHGIEQPREWKRT